MYIKHGNRENGTIAVKCDSSVSSYVSSTEKVYDRRLTFHGLPLPGTDALDPTIINPITAGRENNHSLKLVH